MLKSKVRQIMESKRCTIAELVERTGLAEETILRTRREARPEQFISCTLKTLASIACALEVKVKDLFEED